MRRSGRGRSSKEATFAALDKIKQLRELGLKRSEMDDLEESSDEDDYEYLNDEEYKEYLKKRKEEGDFVVEDEGTGYAEKYDEEEEEGEGEGAKAHPDKGKKRKQVLSEQEAKKNHKLSAMFSKMAKKPKRVDELRTGETIAQEKAAEASLKNFSLDSMLKDMVSKSVSSSSKKRKKSATSSMKKKKSSSSKSRLSKTRGGDDVELFDNNAPPTTVAAMEEGGGDDDDDYYMGGGDLPMSDGEEDMNNNNNNSTANGQATANGNAPQGDAGDVSKKAKLLAMARHRPVKKVEAPSTPPGPQNPKVTFMVTPTTGGSRDMTNMGWTGPTNDGNTEANVTTDNDPGLQTDAKSGKQYVDFFWMDMYEDYFTMQGKVFMFGKVWCEATKSYESCSVEVNNIERVLYVLPRDDHAKTGQPVEFADVHEEVSKMIHKSILRPDERGESAFKCKKTTLKYAFELGNVPRDPTEYLEVHYPMSAEKKRLDVDTEGDTYSQVFGTRQSAIEQLILSRDMMGPCWLRLEGVVFPDYSVSHCRFHAVLETPKQIKILQKVLAEEMKAEGDKGPINVPPPPKLKVLSLSLKTTTSVDTKHHEVVMVSGLLREGVDLVGATPASDSKQQVSNGFTIVRGLTKSVPPGFNEVRKKHITAVPNERSLLSLLLAKIKTMDPDVILGHNIRQFELDVLLTRMKERKVGQWSALGRLKLSSMPKKRADGNGFYSSVSLTPGRLLLDTYTTAKELLLGQRSYTLTELCRTQLNRDRYEVQPVMVPNFYHSPDNLMQLISFNEEDAWLTLQLSFKLEALPLTMQLTNLGGNVWSRTLSGGRAERIEFLLLHEFHRRGYILPDKVSGYSNNSDSDGKNNNKKKGNKNGGDGTAPKKKNKPVRGKPKYGGGLVLEPKRGLYDKFILLLDFNSLYPSIIQEYNICYTTVERNTSITKEQQKLQMQQTNTDEMEEDDENNNNEMFDEDEFQIPNLPDRSIHKELAILPSLIRTLVERRKLVKKDLKREKDQAKRDQLEVRQKALKLTANSMYGCLGFTGFRFYAKPVAALVTSQGRSILQNTVDIAQDTLGYEVIYGDTDSIMINTNCTEMAKVKEIANEVQREINKRYNLLEIAMDGIFKTMLLLKKKKYAALAVKGEKQVGDHMELITEKETKGLDLVRRDWCRLSKNVGHAVLDEILSGKSYEDIVDGIHQHLTEVGNKIKEGKINLEDYVIIKGLNKRPKDYPDAKSQPHLRVALAMVAQQKPVGVGDHIPYVICTITREEYEAKLKAMETEDDHQQQQEDEGGATNNKEDGGKSSYADRAFHPDEVKEAPEGLLQIDIEWYLKQQIVPPTQRLCEPIQGTSPSQIAEHLGLDPAAFRGGPNSAFDDENDPLMNLVDLPDSERFKSCDQVMLCCFHCSLEFPYLGPIIKPQDAEKLLKKKINDPTQTLAGLSCPGCDTPVDASYLENALINASRKAIDQYYEGWLTSDDPSIDISTLQHSIHGRAFTLHGRRLQLQPKFSAGSLYTQLKYIESLTDWDRSVSQLQKFNKSRKPNEVMKEPTNMTKQRMQQLAQVHGQIKQSFVDNNAYNWVDPSLFKLAFKL